jgi:hypothetical protein
MKHEENKTYQFVPDIEHDQDWCIRILEGPYNETVIKYGGIKVNDEDEGIMTFNFFIKESPDTDLTEEDVDLQLEVGDILQDILRVAIEQDTVQLTERKQ